MIDSLKANLIPSTFSATIKSSTPETNLSSAGMARTSQFETLLKKSDTVLRNRESKNQGANKPDFQQVKARPQKQQPAQAAPKPKVVDDKSVQPDSMDSDNDTVKASDDSKRTKQFNSSNPFFDLGIQPVEVPVPNGEVTSEASNSSDLLGLNAELEKALLSIPERENTSETQDVMSQFLNELEANFDVAPEELVAAMATLSPNELQLPPEKNISKIIEKLNLSGTQKIEAKKIFQEMVNKTEYSKWAEFMKASGQELNAGLMTNQELGKETTNQKVEKMNAAFFMQAPQQPVNMNAQKAVSAYTAQLPGKDGIALPEGMEQVASASDESSKSDKSAFFNTAIGASAAGLAQPVRSSKNVEQPLINKDSFESQQNANKNSGLIEQASVQGESLNSNFLNDSSDSDVNNLMKELGLVDSNAESVDTSSDFSQTLNQAGAAIKSQNRIEAGATMGTAALMANDAQSQESVKEVIQSARLLAQDGGGEMRIRLNPDEMGEVSLKVNVKNGQVNVEIVTESSEAKKLFERGLGDLKASLASHRLNVEGIKVDTAQNLAQEFLQQHSQQQERNMAQNFLQQFKQDNQSWRRGFLDEGAKKVSSQLEDKADVTVGNARRPNSARKLDLVA